MFVAAGPGMKVDQLMKTDVTTCSPNDSLARVAQIMWERDCGVVPVVDDEGRVVAMITDRDVCMAAFTQDKLLSHIAVSTAASRMVFSVRPDDTVETAEDIMRRRRVRRLPVTADGGRLVGILSLSDLAHRVGRGVGRVPGDEIAGTLSAIVERNMS